jgi:hypothetical protein
VSGPNEARVADVLTDLARLAGAQGQADQIRTAILADMADKEFVGANVPDWFVDLVEALRDDVDTGWVDFVPGGDRTALVDFLRHPADVLSARVQDDVESLTIVFESAGREATVSWEGPCYRVSWLGKSWEDIED